MKKYTVLFLLLGLTACQGLPAVSFFPALSATPTLVNPTTRNRVKLGDIKVYYEIYGEGQPLILIHGGGGSTQDWSNQIPVFVQHYQVIALDSRGQGRTSDGKTPWTYHLMAEDVVHLMNYLKIPKALAVGWSDGGIITIDLALNHPDRIRAIVAFGANISPEGLPDIITLRQGMVDAQKSKAPVTTAQKLNILWASQPNYTPQQLASIQVPTLILQGENDQEILLDHVKYIAKTIPTAKLVILSGVGHSAPVEEPGTWNRAVLDFLLKIPPFLKG
jgi:pimeloyl-ACP methyl ester carboxylesterase